MVVFPNQDYAIKAGRVSRWAATSYSPFCQFTPSMVSSLMDHISFDHVYCIFRALGGDLHLLLSFSATKLPNINICYRASGNSVKRAR